jgi:outer membrane receptor protein involved in Fe transport
LEAAYIDYSPIGGGPTTYSGGVYWPWTYETSINQVSATISHFADDFLNGEHDFKFGVQLSDGDAITKTSPSATGTYYYHYTYEYDYYGTIYPYDYYYKVDGQAYFYGNEQSSWSAFIDDSWTVTDRLTLNLGLRHDHHESNIPSFPRLDVLGNPTGEMIAGVDPVLEWDHWSPRIGFAYTAGERQEAVIRGSFGVYYDGNVSGNWNSPPPLAPTLTAYWSYYPEGPFEDIAWTWDAGINNVDPNLKAPRTLQYSLSYEKSFAGKYSVGVLGVYKDTKDLIGWEILDDGIYEEVEFTDPFTGREYTLLDPIEFPTARKGNKPGFTIDPEADEYWQKYWAIVLTFNRRFTDNWSMQASYTYSESTGLIPRFLSQWQFNPFYGNKDGSDPNSFLNANDQRLQGDRPHMLRVQANFELPWNLHANTIVNLQSGRPYARQIELPTSGHPPAILEPASDDQRHPFQTIVDVGIGKRFNLGGDVEAKVDLQILNLLNDDATDWFEEVRLNAGDEFIPNYWLKPRRLMMRVGIQF